MEQLTLEQAAVKYDTDNFSYPTPGSNVLIPETTARQWNINAFMAGAEWQKEQYKEVINLMRQLIVAYDIRYPQAKQLLVGYSNKQAFAKYTMLLDKLQSE